MNRILSEGQREKAEKRAAHRETQETEKREK